MINLVLNVYLDLALFTLILLTIRVVWKYEQVIIPLWSIIVVLIWYSATWPYFWLDIILSDPRKIKP